MWLSIVDYGIDSGKDFSDINFLDVFYLEFFRVYF